MRLSSIYLPPPLFRDPHRALDQLRECAHCLRQTRSAIERARGLHRIDLFAMRVMA